MEIAEEKPHLVTKPNKGQRLIDFSKLTNIETCSISSLPVSIKMSHGCVPGVSSQVCPGNYEDMEKGELK